MTFAPSRPPFAFARDTAKKFDHFSFTPGTYEPSGDASKCPWHPVRLRVLWEEDFGLVNLDEEEVTSESATSEAISDGVAQGFCVTEEQVRWLHQTLGELVARWDASAAPGETPMRTRVPLKGYAGFAADTADEGDA